MTYLTVGAVSEFCPWDDGEVAHRTSGRGLARGSPRLWGHPRAYRAEITDTVPPSGLVTYTVPVAGSTATAPGYLPTLMVSVTVFVRVSITDTVVTFADRWRGSAVVGWRREVR